MLYGVFCVSVTNNTLEKLLSSDWLKRSAFLVSTVQKAVTQVEITTKISEVKMKTAGGQLIYFEDRAKPSEDHRRFPKISRILISNHMISRAIWKKNENIC